MVDRFRSGAGFAYIPHIFMTPARARGAREGSRSVSRDVVGSISTLRHDTCGGQTGRSPWIFVRMPVGSAGVTVAGCLDKMTHSGCVKERLCVTVKRGARAMRTLRMSVSLGELVVRFSKLVQRR